MERALSKKHALGDDDAMSAGSDEDEDDDDEDDDEWEEMSGDEAEEALATEEEKVRVTLSARNRLQTLSCIHYLHTTGIPSRSLCDPRVLPYTNTAFGSQHHFSCWLLRHTGVCTHQIDPLRTFFRRCFPTGVCLPTPRAIGSGTGYIRIYTPTPNTIGSVVQMKEIEAFEWNACNSLFDSHSAATVPEALEYMGNKFAFYIPGVIAQAQRVTSGRKDNKTAPLAALQNS
eukprot:1192327-Prorocentrum_minimum.AAC.4